MIEPKMSKHAKPSYYIPEEILLEIFYKLPIKSLGRCLCVCKTWLSLIKNPSFISMHLNNSKNSNTGLFLLKLVDKEYNYNRADCVLHLDNQEFGEYTHLMKSSPSDLEFQYKIVGSCNGLLCLAKRLEFVIWNPIIDKYIKLPNPHSVYSVWAAVGKVSIGLGFDSTRDDYKVLRISSMGPQSQRIVARLYSLKNKCWEKLAPPKYHLYSTGWDDGMVFVNGVVHFVGYDEIVNKRGRHKLLVVGFDMSKEVFQRISLPECLSNNESHMTTLQVKEHGESSSIAAIQVELEPVFGHRTHVWVMKEYGVMESWSKIFRFEETTPTMFRTMGFRKNGDLIGCVKGLGEGQGQVASCDIIMGTNKNKNITKNLGVRGYFVYSYVYTYVESLVLLDLNLPEDAEEIDYSTDEYSYTTRTWEVERRKA
ncbi:hypothetical protein CCACVL1_12998 [Corchorus capsularis]|uniref:F-box domain-containing protein n=1 Tax=Corchorus capsularis TaxID=210143 RepID=A0A1R3ICQ3_COCAP|nr:hypothetical protein CCACVL1_12998 [Corchorus capsularis]